jgi:L-asparagine transporter-like permease
MSISKVTVYALTMILFALINLLSLFIDGKTEPSMTTGLMIMAALAIGEAVANKQNTQSGSKDKSEVVKPKSNQG